MEREKEKGMGTEKRNEREMNKGKGKVEWKVNGERNVEGEGIAEG